VPAGVTPPAIVALGASTLVCALTASASVLGWPRDLRRPRQRPWSKCQEGLSAAEAATLLALVPPGERVRVEAVDEAAAIAFAHAVLALLNAEGRFVEEQSVFTVRGIFGTGYLHFKQGRQHGILVMHQPAQIGPMG
jgi:hypothetical protein